MSKDEARKGIRVEHLREGDVIDLENDPYVGADGQDVPWQYEYAVVIGTERETANCVRIDTDEASYGMPPSHRVPLIGREYLRDR